MGSLEYAIGGIHLNAQRLLFTGVDVDFAEHRFVVSAEGDSVGLYASLASRHFQVIEQFNLTSNRIVGGGSVYCSSDSLLVLGGYSRTHHSIPNESAERFARLLLPQVLELGVDIRSIETGMYEGDLHPFWRNRL